MKKILFVFIGLAAVLACAAFLSEIPRHRYTYIVVHHSASRNDNHASIRAFHAREHGWREAAYHLILSNGSAQVPLGHLEATDRYGQMGYSPATKNALYNLRGLHLCVIGNYEEKPVPANLQGPLANALGSLMEAYDIPFENVVLHKEASSTACPGKHLTRSDLRRWLDGNAAACPPAVAAQQQLVIREPLSARTFLKTPVVRALFSFAAAGIAACGLAATRNAANRS